ncbi:hypothetical protein CROQUDRAFT_42196, partial [Cronartium quercuum f. sp. fusiforme G11]
RRCKSESSFEKHKIPCTHRLGPLKLECRYCRRPYTYVGYLAKHEAECVKVHPVGCFSHISTTFPSSAELWEGA